MSKQNKHIDFLEEFVRLLSISKHADRSAKYDDFTLTEITYVPSEEKSKILLASLLEHQFRLRPRFSLIHKSFVILTIAAIIGSILYITPYKRPYSRQIFNPEVIEQDDTVYKEKKIFIADTIPTLSTSYEKENLNTTSINNYISDTSSINIPDSMNTLIPQLDTLIIKEVSFDSSSDEQTHEKNQDLNMDCNLPLKIIFHFDAKSSILTSQDTMKIDEIVRIATACQMLKAIRIKAYRPPVFFFFKNKTIASQRAEVIIKCMKKRGLPTNKRQMIKIKFVNSKRNSKQNHANRIELILR